MSISDRLDEITARADAATERPWEIETHYGMSQSRRRQIVVPGWMTPIAVLGQENPYGDPDAEFIAASRTDVPELVEAVRRRDAALRAVLDLHKPEKFTDSEDTCSGCDIGTLDPPTWPCQTVRAVRAALGEES